MTFGEKLKSLRTLRDWTQPQAAEAIGVEQSYLSKLENDHSVPSGDVFRRIAGAFEASVADIVDGLEAKSLNQLRQIPDVTDYLSTREHASNASRRRRIQGLVVSVALGASLMYAGMSHLFFADVVYWYKSDGVIRAGESKELFQMLKSPSDAPSGQEDAVTGDIQARLDEQFLLSVGDYRGESFNIRVDGGSRTYVLERVKDVDPWQNKLLTFIGIFTLTFGIVGLLVASASTRNR